MSASNCFVGLMPASESFVALTMTMTRIWALLLAWASGLAAHTATTMGVWRFRQFAPVQLPLPSGGGRNAVPVARLYRPLPDGAGSGGTLQHRNAPVPAACRRPAAPGDAEGVPAARGAGRGAVGACAGRQDQHPGWPLRGDQGGAGRLQPDRGGITGGGRAHRAGISLDAVRLHRGAAGA